MPSHDAGARRRGVRRGKETGCWLYIPGEYLAAAGFKKGEPPPWYRIWRGGRRPRFMVNLYREA